MASREAGSLGWTILGALIIHRDPWVDQWTILGALVIHRDPWVDQWTILGALVILWG